MPETLPKLLNDRFDFAIEILQQNAQDAATAYDVRLFIDRIEDETLQKRVHAGVTSVDTYVGPLKY